jgi:uncharacterized repeat protein (TIGR01451 family)
LNSDNNNAADTDTVDATPDLALAKSDGVDTVQPGQTLTYTLTITNTGNQDAAGVNLTDTLPPYTSFVRASDGGVLSGSVVTWPPVLVPGGGASVTRTVTVKVSSALPSGVTEIRNSAVMKHPEDASPDNNTAVDTDTVNAAPDLSLTKQGPASIMAGTPIVYTLLYANKGNQDATGVEIVETVPKNASFVASAGSPGWSCADGAPTGSKCTYSIGPLAANTSGKVLFAVITDKKYKGDPLTNTASIHDDGNNGVDPIAGNNTGSATTVIEPFPIPALNPWGILFSVLLAVFGAVLCMRRWKVIR